MKLRVLAAVPLILSTALLAACGNGLLSGAAKPSAGNPVRAVTAGSAKPKSSPIVALYQNTSAARIYRMAHAKAMQATSVHFVGDVRYDHHRIGLDIRTSTARTMAAKVAIDSAKMSVRRRGSALWASGNVSYWNGLVGMPRVQAELIESRWIKSPASNPFAPVMNHVTSVKYLADTTHETAAQVRGLRRVRGVTVDGQPTIGLYSPGEKATMYVATTGSGLPLMITQRGQGRIVFSDWNAPVRVAAPTNVMHLHGS